MLREAAVEILEHSIRAADPYPRTLDILRCHGNHLLVGDLEYELDAWNHIFVVGAGKATQSVALAVEEVLGDLITDGLVILKRGEAHYLNRIQVIEAAHPVPDEAGLEGAKRIVGIAQRAAENDLVFSAFTGGSSALMVWPAQGLHLADKQVLNRILLECGASIQEINAVRKHVSRVKGGRLGLRIFPAELINLTVSDVIGDPLDCITDLTVPDTSTYHDAWATLDKYDLWKIVPSSVRAHLQRGAEIETPKAYAHPYHSFITVTSDVACRKAADKCQELGFETIVLTNSMEGESRLAATAFLNSAREIIQSSYPGKRYAFLSSGETTVRLNGGHGEGGRNQEFALSSAFQIVGLRNAVVASLATDGTDGPTDACGGLVDSETISRARSRGMDPESSLSNHMSKRLLAATGDLLTSGPTGTNVNDVALMLIEA